MKEVWKSIKDYNYSVSNLGNVRRDKGLTEYSDRRVRIDPERMLSTQIGKRGYQYVDLYKNNKRKRFYVHRLVAEYFIESIEEYPFVNHIDGDKTNNCISNLEWCTKSENALHWIDHKLTGKPKSIRQGNPVGSSKENL